MGEHYDLDEPVRLTGGCQCGAVRYALHARPERPCICSCRMCQKAVGNLFASFAGVPTSTFELTRGEIAWWSTSSTAERGFCRTCGTPLVWTNAQRTTVSVTIGSLDRPEDVKPLYSYGAEGRLPWLEEVVLMQATVTGAGPAGHWPVEEIRRTNRQHPDHDTEIWPPTEERPS